MTGVNRLATAAVVLALAAGGCSSDELDEPAKPSASRSSDAASPSPSASTSSAAPDLTPFYSQKLKWRKCDSGFQCTRVTVPLDYAAPTGRTIELSVNRLRAGSKKARLGSLLVNPGGPGGSGLEYALAARSVVSSAVRERFDIVGFDPRGVGESSPVDCLNDAETDEFAAADGSPDTPAEEAQLVTISEKFAERCAERSGELLAHVGTRDAARDLDVLREVLGDKRLNLLGKSYGTYLGATYAELFPNRVGRLVLDGALDPTDTPEEVARGQALGFEVALTAFVDDCRRRLRCPLPRSRKGALDEVQRILKEADRKPFRGDGERQVTEGLAIIGIVIALYDEEAWSVLRDALREAKRGDGSTLLLLADYYFERDERGRYTNNANDAIYAVNCLDRPVEGDLPDLRALSKEFSAAAPRFGAYLAWGSLPCAYWPHPPQGTPQEIRAAGAAPILVIGTERDPATPVEWAVSLADQLESGVLLTWDGDGHTAYRRGSKCVDRIVDAYLISAKLPRDGSRCG